ncbi:DUF6171 family protein [Schleiferilactobacillus shenzhenensis]|uniref:DUF6171 family protein n=1 Tax=Schleiferilactobacillus shenzhenensis TaxID=1231337 RepID=UPI001C65D6FE
MSADRAPCWTCGDLAVTDPAAINASVADQLALEPAANRVSDTVRAARLAVCRQCPFYQHGTCTECGCYVAFRASLKNKACPRHAWNQDKEPNQ